MRSFFDEDGSSSIFFNAKLLEKETDAWEAESEPFPSSTAFESSAHKKDGPATTQSPKIKNYPTIKTHKLLVQHLHTI